MTAKGRRLAAASRTIAGSGAWRSSATRTRTTGGTTLYARREAARLGMSVLGPYAYRRSTRGPAPVRELARRVARAQPDALLPAGGYPFYGPSGKEPPGWALVRELSDRLGGPLPILAPDSWGLRGAGRVRRPGTPRRTTCTSALRGRADAEPATPPDRGSCASSARPSPAGIVTQDALYTAQATEILLDAIARSDGTRAGVIEELFTTRVRNGILGSFGFDRNGDTTLNEVTILRAEEPGGGSTVKSVDGAAVDRVLVPPPKLVGG